MQYFLDLPSCLANPESVVTIADPHYARETVSDAWHCPCLFSLGAAGDVVPISRYGDSRRRIGTALGLAAILAERTFSTEVAPQLSAEAAECDAQVYDGAGDGRPNWKACESQASSSSFSHSFLHC